MPFQGRLLWLVAASSLLSVQALAGEGTADESSKVDKRKAEQRAAREKRILNRRELERAVAPQLAVLQDCYVKHSKGQKKATGELRLELLIRPDGSIQKLWVVAPGVKKPKAFKALNKCVQSSFINYSFPEKPGFTNAVLPFFYMQSKAKGAGPIHSCWSAKGCPAKRRAIKKSRRKTSKKTKTKNKAK